MQDDDASFPRSFGPYTLKRQIASGGMAELYLGETRGPGGFSKPIVVKMIRPDLGADPRFVSMFTEEAKTLAGFVHGNIVPIFDFGQIGGRPYLVMEFIDGVDVETMMETCRVEGIPLPPDVAVWIGIGVASALHYAHSACDAAGSPLKLVHRDVSPNNVLVSRAGEVKLCDFGIAFSEAQHAGDDADIVKGKLHYMSPEQAAGKGVDRRSDIFSLGVTLYELIVGRHPAGGGSRVDVLRCLAERRGYPTIAEAAPWLDPRLAAIVDRAVSFNPAQRYETAEEVRQELTQLLHESYRTFSPSRVGDLVVELQERLTRQALEGDRAAARAELASFASEVRSVSVVSAGLASAPRRKRRLRIAVAVAAAVLVAAAVAISLLLLPDDEPGRRPEIADGGAKADAGPPRVITPKVPPVVQPKPAHLDAGIDAGGEPTNGSTAERPRGYGFLEANASPWANVRVDGKPRGDTPLKPPLKLPAGRHRAEFSNPDFPKKVQRWFLIKPGQTYRLIVDMEE
jgi:eukaryotic-like serine/threonine-protein kinase